ncbi:MAG: hypothetical protein A3F16_08085 [Deltaproteobacteria bacterium RIFCSPHIGHO2_12_FULL_43_9]|nr:MAG: hypothetical protein A3F16_08085 [Deltaproteobacteria bacterium RIFCSPHIGHO2_12_FULL_43_9]
MKKLLFVLIFILSSAASYASDGVTLVLRGFVQDGPVSLNPVKDINLLEHPTYFTELRELKDLKTIQLGELSKARVVIELWKRDDKNGSQLFLDHRKLRASILNPDKNVKYTRVLDDLYPELSLLDFIITPDDLSFTIPWSFQKTIDKKKRRFNLSKGMYLLVARLLDEDEKQPDTLGNDNPETILQAYEYDFFTRKEVDQDGNEKIIVDDDAYFQPTRRLRNLSRLLDVKLWDSELEESEDRAISLNIIFPTLKQFLTTLPQLPEPGKIRSDHNDTNYITDNEFVIWTGITQHGAGLNRFVIRNGDILIRAGEDSQIALGLVPPPLDFTNDPLMGGLDWNDFPIPLADFMKKIDPEAADDDGGDSFADKVDMLLNIEKVAKISVALYSAVLQFLIQKGENVPSTVEDSFRSLTDKEISMDVEITRKEYLERLATGETVYEEEEDGETYYYAKVNYFIPDGVIGFEDAFTYRAELIKNDYRKAKPNLRIGFIENDKFCYQGLTETEQGYPTTYDKEGRPVAWGKILHHNCMPKWSMDDLRLLMIGKTLVSPPDVNPFHIPVNLEEKIDQALRYYPGTIFLTHVGIAVIEYNDKNEKELWVYDAYPNSDGFGGIRRTTWAEFFGSTPHPITEKKVVHATAGGVFRAPGRDSSGRLVGVEAARQTQRYYRIWKHRGDESVLSGIKKDVENEWIERFMKRLDSEWFDQKLEELSESDLHPVTDDPFDYGFDWTTEELIACSELAYRAYAKIGINIIPNLTMLRMPLEGIHKLGWEVIAKFLQASPQSIMLSPRVARVADFLSHPTPSIVLFRGNEVEKAKFIGEFIDSLIADHREHPVDISKLPGGNLGKVDLNKWTVNNQPVFSLYPVPIDQ